MGAEPARAARPRGARLSRGGLSGAGRSRGGGRSGAKLSGAALAGAGLLAMLAACDGSRAQTSGLADLRAQIDGSRVCALLIGPQWPIEGSAAMLAQPGVDALVAAGLVRRDPVNDRANVTPQARIAVTPLGERDLRLFRLSADSPPAPQLCLGKKQVTAIERNGDGPVRYRYRIVEAPDWTRRPDIRAAYPFVARLLDREQRAELGVIEKDGRLEVPGGIDQANVAEIGNTGFYPCPYEGAGPDDDPCR
ncbi:hypothetical protein [Allosphingosinicella deserti]|uniref:Uncharacterized protein n=1 Tax=Allosphingosinicella deserti TaxID=2116704 RepID=A0A2P7QM51_9SPHN|nr:hypothetical protein [Sphingomonas deserti]PSJ39031.1 hypothetical protein C7I55_17185 [Sphingomonas deserti]